MCLHCYGEPTVTSLFLVHKQHPLCYFEPSAFLLILMEPHDLDVKSSDTHFNVDPDSVREKSVGMRTCENLLVHVRTNLAVARFSGIFHHPNCGCPQPPCIVSFPVEMQDPPSAWL